MKEALDMYNKLGVTHKILFKLDHSALQPNGVLAAFSLICLYAKAMERKTPLNGGVTLRKSAKNHKCPVCVHFKFLPNEPNGT